MKATLGWISCVAALVASGAVRAAVCSADFSVRLGEMRPSLHAAGYSPTFSARAERTDWGDQDIRALNLSLTRTHDWSLHAAGLPVCDTHFIFPLPAADPADPANYRFAPTDAMLKLARENLGQKILFRLGTSIEHSVEGHRYNSQKPADFAQYAEIAAAIVRHYTRGWAKGFTWGDDIVYWEIWNEPDLKSKKCWSGTADEFNRFYAVVLKRLRDEFGDTIRVGGPAFASFATKKFTDLLDACDAKGVVPDFLSWHYYGTDVARIPAEAKTLRAALQKRGPAYARIETMVNEWRYVKDWKEPTNRIGIDSAAYTVAVLSELQNAPDAVKLGSAFHYGSGQTGNWGLVDGHGRRHRAYWGQWMAGQLFASCRDWCRASGSRADGVYLLAGRAAEGETCQLLVSGYLNKATSLAVKLSGVPKGSKARVLRLDDSQLEPREVADWTLADGKLTLAKAPGSAVFLVTFAAEGKE